MEINEWELEITNDGDIAYIQEHNVQFGLVTALEGQFEGTQLGIAFFDNNGKEQLRFIPSKDVIAKLMAFIYHHRTELFPEKGSSK